jgi:hypothetical protein
MINNQIKEAEKKRDDISEEEGEDIEEISKNSKKKPLKKFIKNTDYGSETEQTEADVILITNQQPLHLHHQPIPHFRHYSNQLQTTPNSSLCTRPSL